MVGYISRDSDKFMLRLPDGLRDRIKAKADQNGRSMNAEIVQVLEREYPAEAYSAEDFLEFLKELTGPMSIEDSIDKESALNQVLEEFGIGLEASLVSGDIILEPKKDR